MIETRNGFTLIELLIVVAIIAILAAIAVPNFLEAQTRAKVSRVRADMRSMATAVESYRVDNNSYITRNSNWDNPSLPKSVLPPFREKIFDPDIPDARVGLRSLTTPIAYITSLPSDPFHVGAKAQAQTDPEASDAIDFWDPIQTDAWLSNLNLTDSTGRGKGWTLYSVGPDRVVGNSISNQGNYPPTPPIAHNSFAIIYDPTNGTNSLGNIYRFQGGLTQKEILWNILP
jgi:prepilin-type N-terminal cleavage/methylation domain-containing protein